MLNLQEFDRFKVVIFYSFQTILLSRLVDMLLYNSSLEKVRAISIVNCEKN